MVNLLGQISVAAGQAAVAATTVHTDLLYAAPQEKETVSDRAA